MRGAVEPSTGLPAASIASSRPSVVRQVSPDSELPNANRRSFGFLAASWFFTTSTSLNPVSNAVTTRSTPENTSTYVADPPSTFGAGNRPGHDSDTSVPARRAVSREPEPPPDSFRSTMEARGEYDPSRLATRVASRSAQSPSLRRTRCG